MAECSDVKLICMDMDGTLFGGWEQIPEANVVALRECVSKGIKIALVSGRNYRFLMTKAAEISNDIIIVSANGARIDDKVEGNCIFEGTFDEEFAGIVNRIMWDGETYYEIYTADINYAFSRAEVPQGHKRSLKRYLQNRMILSAEQVTSFDAAPKTGIYKFVAFCEDLDKIAALRTELDKQGIVHSASGSTSVEVMAKNVDKGSAIRFLSSFYSIPVSEIMAFGDYTNDTSMLNACGHPVAMQNAVSELKEVAEYIAPLNTLGGVGLTINKLVLGK
ncbi:MAG: Cof-type HAD-IIB family hydrolase [Clostridiales bacterium]|nr:Cof-type HAD-IIB family hydrolase [Clostridiales bacterium]